jgi:hypothetical protein
MLLQMVTNVVRIKSEVLIVLKLADVRHNTGGAVVEGSQPDDSTISSSPLFRDHHDGNHPRPSSPHSEPEDSATSLFTRGAALL